MIIEGDMIIENKPRRGDMVIEGDMIIENKPLRGDMIIELKVEN